MIYDYVRSEIMKKFCTRPFAGKFICAMLAAAALISCFSTAAFAEEKKTPSGIAFDSIAKQIEIFEEGKNYASFETSVFCGDDVIYTGCFGYADRENNVLADEETVYEWGSVSKTMIWVSVMQLYEQGKLDLETDIRNYLPNGFLRKLKYDEPITMLDIMNHKGGWQETMYTIQVKDENKIVPLGQALQYSEPPQVFRPGEVEAYSNWGAALAGYVVECVSGTDYGEYVRENILKPLGMEHTSVSPDHRDNTWVREQREKLKSYMVIGGSDGEGVNESLGTNMTYINLYPAGGVTGTIGDMTKYAQSFVSDKCPLFEKQETLDLMFSASSFYGGTDIPLNCHGFFPEIHDVTVLGHSGSTDACSTNLLFDRESKVGIVVMMNQRGSGSICSQLPNLIFGSGENNPLLRSGEITVRNDISGYYTSTRSYFKGMMKITGVFGINPISQISEDKYTIANLVDIDRIGDDFYYYDYSGSTGIFGGSVTSDGRKILQGLQMIDNRTVYLKIAMIVLYVVTAITAAVLLIVKLVKKIIKKGSPYIGSKTIASAQAARIVSCVGIIIMYMTCMSNMCITKAQGTFFGVLQIICLAVFAAAAVVSVMSMLSKKDEKAKNIVYIFGTLSNVFSVVFIVVFELCCFWI